MNSLEPNVIALSWFVLLWGICCLAFFQLAGMYPLRAAVRARPLLLVLAIPRCGSCCSRRYAGFCLDRVALDHDRGRGRYCVSVHHPLCSRPCRPVARWQRWTGDCGDCARSQHSVCSSSLRIARVRDKEERCRFRSRCCCRWPGLLTAAGGYVFMVHLGQTGPSYAVAFLGIFATVAMWVFPEVTKKSPGSLK